jgi:hypothetical protein
MPASSARADEAGQREEHPAGEVNESGVRREYGPDQPSDRARGEVPKALDRRQEAERGAPDAGWGADGDGRMLSRLHASDGDPGQHECDEQDRDARPGRREGADSSRSNSWRTSISPSSSSRAVFA